MSRKLIFASFSAGAIATALVLGHDNLGFPQCIGAGFALFAHWILDDGEWS